MWFTRSKMLAPIIASPEFLSTTYPLNTDFCEKAESVTENKINTKIYLFTDLLFILNFA